MQYSEAQISSNLDFNGYLSAMPSLIWSKEKFSGVGESEKYYHQSLLHNRLNFNWYPGDKFTASIQLRNQFIYGDFIEMAEYENGLVPESYFLPLTLQQSAGDKGLLSLSADRFWAQFTSGNLDIKVGRQRINWGQTFAWNPNDIFNSYNFFEFDYVEKPGADAIRVQYYTGMASQLDIAAKLDSAGKVTAAGLYRFNRWNSDFQVIGGYYSQSVTDSLQGPQTESDFVAGLGFTTDFKGVSLRTEMSYLYPTNESVNQKELLLWSIGLDYSLTNDLYLSTEFYYANRIQQPAGANFVSFYSGPITLKNLTFTRYNFFISASYPITPLINANIAAMYFSDDILKGYYTGPTLDFSLLENLDLSTIVQYFNFKIEEPVSGITISNNNLLAFLRLKWSF
jgi:hypothetical protein